jgi:hypothetical protein
MPAMRSALAFPRASIWLLENNKAKCTGVMHATVQ